jgi:hypothetical protein
MVFVSILSELDSLFKEILGFRTLSIVRKFPK